MVLYWDGANVCRGSRIWKIETLTWKTTGLWKYIANRVYKCSWTGATSSYANMAINVGLKLNPNDDVDDDDDDGDDDDDDDHNDEFCNRSL